MKRRRVRKGAEEIGREEGYDEVRQGPRATSAYPATVLSCKFLSCCSSVKK